MALPESPRQILLRVRDLAAAQQFQIDNFDFGGWRVRNSDNTGWIRMGPSNVRVRNPEHDENTHAVDDEEFPLWLQPIDRSID